MGGSLSAKAGGSGSVAHTTQPLEHFKSVPAFLAEEHPKSLMRRPPPFGYYNDATTIDDVERIVRNTSTPPPNLRTNLSCAVVGNSGTLKFGALGHEIDQSDIVFRVNHAPPPHLPEGLSHVQYTGKKTIYRVVTSGWRGEFRRDPRARLLIICDVDHSLAACHRPLAAHGPHPHLHVVNPLFYDAVRVHAGNSGMPLAGLVTVALALRMCGGVRVYGLSTNRATSHEQPCAYYWSCSATYSHPRSDHDDLFVQRRWQYKLRGAYTDRAYHSRRVSVHDFPAHARTLERWNASGLISIRV